MSVGRADANGSGSSVGSAAPVKSDESTAKTPAAKSPAAKAAHGDAAPAKAPKAGIAGGPNTQWSQPPLKFGEIDKALGRLSTILQREQGAKPEALKALKKQETQARTALTVAFEHESERGAPISRTLFEPKSGYVRERSAKIAEHYKGQPGEKIIGDEIELDQFVRVVDEIGKESEATERPARSPAAARAQEQELDATRDDLTDYVTRPRPDESGLSANDLKERQFRRLENVLKAATQDNPNLDPHTFATSVINCARAIHISKADVPRLEKIVTPYSKPVGQYDHQNEDILIWIDMFKKDQVK